MKKSAQPKKNSLRTFVIFCGIVGLLIVISLSIKIVHSIQSSIYDPRHNFVVALHSDRYVTVYGIDPQDKEISVLHVDSHGKELEPGEDLGIAVDAIIPFEQTEKVQRLSDVLPGLLFHGNYLGWFDIARMILVTRGMEQSERTATELAYDETVVNSYTFDTLFSDEKIVQERLSIAIVNATGEAGIGRRLERVLSSVGGNVISVTTAQDTKEGSEVTYVTEKSYTQERITRLLGIQSRFTDQQSISDILIVLGRDALQSKNF